MRKRTPSKPQKKRSLFWRILRWVLIVLLAIVVTAGLFVTWMTQTGHGRKFLIARISTILSNHVFVGEIHARRIDGPIFGRFTLRDVRLTDDQDIQAGYIEEAHVEYRLLDLTKKHVNIESLEIRGLDLFGRVRDDGTMNLGALFQPAENPNPDPDGFAVTIQRLEIDGGNVRIVDERVRELIAAFTQPRLVANFHMDGRGGMNAGISELSSTMAFGLAPGAEFAARIDDLLLDIEREVIEFSADRLTLGDTGLFGFEGGMKRAEPGSDDLFEYFEARMPQLVFSPEEVRALVPSLPLATMLTIDAAIKGPPEDLRLNASLTGADQGAVAEVVVDITDGVDSRLRGQLDVQDFEPELWFDLPGLTGDLNAQIQFAAQGLTPQRLEADLKVLIDPSTLLGYALDSGKLHLTFKNEALQIETLDFRAGRAHLSGDGSATLDGDVRLELELDVPDLADLQERSPIEGNMRGSLYAGIKAAGHLNFDDFQDDALNSIDGIIEHVVRHLDIAADVRARSIDTPDVKIQRADITLRADAAEQLQARLDVDVQRALIGDIDVDYAVAHAQVDGKRLRLQADAAALGATASLNGQGVWSPTRIELELDGLSFEKGDLRAALQRSTHARIDLSEEGGLTGVIIEHLDIAGHGLALKTQRLSYESNGAIRGDILARVDDLEALNELEALVDLEDLQLKGAVEVQGDVHGTIDRPQYDVRVRTDRFHVMGVGPVDGSMRARQLPKRLEMDGLLCLKSNQRGFDQAQDCSGGDVLLRAQELIVPVEPGFTSVGLKFNPKGQLGGHAEIGRIQIEKLSGLSDMIDEYKLKGYVHLRLYLDGTFNDPNAAAIVDLEDVWVTFPLEKATKPEDATLGPIETQINLKVANAEDHMSVFHWSMGATGLQVDQETWARAKGDIEAPIRGLLLGKVPLRQFLTEARGTVIALEVPERQLRDLPPALLPEELDRAGTVYLSLDVVSYPQFTGAKSAFHAKGLRWEDAGPIEVFASAMSADETALRVDVMSEQTQAHASLEATLHRSIRELLSRGISPKDRLDARLHIPELDITEVPIPALQERARELREQGGPNLAPKLSGYIDVYNTLEDLQMHGRLHAKDIATSRTSSTDAALEFQYAKGSSLGFGDNDARLQLMASVCGPNQTCALELYAAAKPELTSGTFLFGSESAQARAMERLKQMPYAVQLRADQAPLSALLPMWLFADIAANVEGELSADLNAQGSLDAFPNINGDLELTGVRGEIIPLARYIENMELKVSIVPHDFTLETLHIDDGVGTVDGKGHIASRKDVGARGAIDFHFDRFLLSDGSGLGVYLTADMPVDAVATKDALDVDVVIKDATIYVPDSVLSGELGGPMSLPENIIFLEEDQSLRQYVEYAERSKKEEKRDAQRFESVSIPVRINLRSENDIRVQQRFADLYAAADMQLKLKNGNIETSGGVNVTSGYAQVFGKRFDVKLGRVLFDGGGDGPFDPRLRVEAQHRLPRKTAALLNNPTGQYASVSVVIDSHVSNLDIQLRSDPPMSESEILNVLLTGKPLETDDAEKPEALAAAGTLLAGFLTDQLDENPVLDSLTVELDDKDGNIDSRVEGGRYFGKDQRIYASVAYIAGADTNENSVEVSWQFILAQLRTSSLRLELRWGDRRTGAVEFLYDLRLEKGWRFVRQ